MFDITPIIEAVAALIGVIITCVLIPYIKSKTTTEQKKAYVIAWLKERGITVDEAELDALIEAAVYELEQGLIPLEGIAIEATTEVTESKEDSDHE